MAAAAYCRGRRFLLHIFFTGIFNQRLFPVGQNRYTKPKGENKPPQWKGNKHMGVFTTNNGKVKNTMLLMAFTLSMLLIALFVLAYMLTADLVALYANYETGSFLEVWLPPFLICLVVSTVCCCLMFLLKTKITVPVAFALLALYYMVFTVILRTNYSGTGEGLAILLQMIRVYMLPAVLTGNLLCWSAYLLYFKKRDLFFLQQ